MAAVERDTGIASAEMRGDRLQRARAAGRLATALQEAAADLAPTRADGGTRVELERLRGALVKQGAALEDLAGAIDQGSAVAIDDAEGQIRASHAALATRLKAFKRAGYPVQ
jgi:hypothetical protein